MRKPFAAIAAAVAASFVATASLAWEPTKPVEIVVAAGAGGASDQMVRMMQAAIQKNNLMKQPMVVSLKGGASGGEALMYMKESAGDPNKVLIAYSLIYMLPLSAKIPFDWRELTPVSVLALDEFVLWDNTTLPYKTTKEFIDAAKKADPVFKMGGTGSKREDHVLTIFIEKKTGAKFAYLPYKSGGEAATQLVGNHTASNVNNPSENLEVWRAGQVRALCVFSKERMQYKAKVTETMSWNDIPTCKEKGLNVEYQMLRGIFMPPGVTPDQVAFYVDLLKTIRAMPEWQDFTATAAFTQTAVGGQAYQSWAAKAAKRRSRSSPPADPPRVRRSLYRSRQTREFAGKLSVLASHYRSDASFQRPHSPSTPALRGRVRRRMRSFRWDLAAHQCSWRSDKRPNRGPKLTS